MRSFIETLALEIGRDTYHAVLSKSGLSHDWRSPEFFLAMDAGQTAQAYARLQWALRTYYGRGARGILMRIGSKLWSPVLKDAPIAAKAQSAVVRGLPKSLRGKPALDLLAGLICETRGDVTAHTLDLDLLLVDRASPTTLSQSDDSPICFVTFGLIRECLYWATGRVYDIEERACRAAGAPQCEFKIITGAQT
jgi:predicted hydrocarbon binding protein